MPAVSVDIVVPAVGALDHLDERADAVLEQLRGTPALDRLFSAASRVGDFSVVWHVVNVALAITRRRLAQPLLFAALLGAESLVVNQGVKRLFGRVRPTETGDERYRVRRPSTSSFPSGHASSAFFAASLLTAITGRRWAPLWFAAAIVVAVSRAYVRIHHVSDVVAGAVVGLGLARIARATGAVRRLRRVGGR